MQVQGFWHVFALGAFGGLLVELLRWYKLAESEQLPAYARRPRYWLLTGLMICAGGVLAALYGTGPINAVAVVNLGASAPALVGAVARGGAPSTLAAVLPQPASPAGPSPPVAYRKTDGSATLNPPPATLRRFLAFGR